MTPPIWIDDIEAALREPRDDQRGNYGAARLLLRMQALGISKYHPTPVEAIERAEAALRELSNFDNSTSDVAKPYRESVAPPPKPSVALRFPRVARAALNRAKARLSRRGS